MCTANLSRDFLNHPSNFGRDRTAPEMPQTVDGWETLIVDQTLKIKAVVLEPNQESCLASVRVAAGETQTIGRGISADVAIQVDKRMSRQHFSVACVSGRGILRDLDSTNGTFVNGRPVDSADLLDGDQIIAGSTAFTVHLITA